MFLFFSLKLLSQHIDAKSIHIFLHSNVVGDFAIMEDTVTLNIVGKL